MNLYPWQQSQWARTLQQIQQKRLPHALMLTGQAGLGKADFAQMLAQYRLCAAPTEQGPCGQCRSCQLFSVGNHPDFYAVACEGKSKVIKVEQIRQLINQLNTTATLEGYQVAVIDAAEQMNVASSNALLKTLEEPAGDVLLILVSHQQATIPATILSRCQRLHFHASDDAATTAWLAAQTTAADPALLLRLANQAPLQALALAEMDYLAVRDTLLKHVIAAFCKDQDPLAPISQWLKNYEPLQILRTLQSLLFDLQRLQLGSDQQHITHLDRAEPLAKLAQRINPLRINALLSKIQSDIALLQRGANPNLQLLFEAVLC